MLTEYNKKQNSEQFFFKKMRQTLDKEDYFTAKGVNITKFTTHGSLGIEDN